MKEAGFGVAKIKGCLRIAERRNCVGQVAGSVAVRRQRSGLRRYFLQKTDDFHVITADLLIENDLPTLRECSITSPDFITWSTDIGIFCKQSK